MLDHLDLLVQDLERAKNFYSAVLRPLGGRLIHEDQFGLTFETGDSHDGYIWIGLGEPRPFHFAFQAKTREAVNEFYEVALANGGKDNGVPGERPSSDGEGYYAAFVIDPEGYRLEAALEKSSMAEVSRDIAFVRESAGFRYRAAAIILENGRVLMAGNARDDYFYSIGGAVKLGETAEEACLREVMEETGIKLEIDRLLFIHENFFKSGDGQTAVHELTFYFLMKSQNHEDFKLGATAGLTETLHWLALADYAKYKVYPTFFAKKLQNLPQFIERIVTYE